MAFELNLDLSGDTQLMAGFSRFADDVKDLSEAFREIAQDFHQTVEKKQFETEGAYGSGGWKPLSDNPPGKGYASWKAKNYPGRPLLVQSGLMKESLMGENPYSIEDIQPLQMRLGTQIKYALYHQKGTSKMPARPVIALSPSVIAGREISPDVTRWSKIIHKHLFDQAKEAGLL